MRISPLALFLCIPYNIFDDRLEISSGFEPYEIMYLRRVRDPSLHVLEALLIGLLVRYADDLRAASGYLYDLLGQAFYRYLLLAPDIEDLSIGLLVLDDSRQCVDYIPDVQKTPGLLSRTVNGDIFIMQSLCNEPRDDHAVRAGLSRPDGIKKPDYRGRDILLFPIHISEYLIDRLGSRITPSGFHG